MVSENVLIEVFRIWKTEEPIMFLVGNVPWGSECACLLLKGVLTLSLKIGEPQAAVREIATPLLIRIISDSIS